MVARDAGCLTCLCAGVSGIAGTRLGTRWWCRVTLADAAVVLVVAAAARVRLRYMYEATSILALPIRCACRAYDGAQVCTARSYRPHVYRAGALACSVVCGDIGYSDRSHEPRVSLSMVNGAR